MIADPLDAASDGPPSMGRSAERACMEAPSAVFRRVGSRLAESWFRCGVLEGRASVMPGAYSADLRQRVLLACAHGRLSRGKVTRLFQVAESTVYRWLQAWRREGRCQAKPHA